MNQENKVRGPMSIKIAFDVVIKLAQLGVKSMNTNNKTFHADVEKAVQMVTAVRDRQTDVSELSKEVRSQMLKLAKQYLLHTANADKAFAAQNGAVCSGESNRAYARLRRIKEIGQFARTDEAAQWVREQVKQGKLG